LTFEWCKIYFISAGNDILRGPEAFCDDNYPPAKQSNKNKRLKERSEMSSGSGEKKLESTSANTSTKNSMGHLDFDLNVEWNEED